MDFVGRLEERGDGAALLGAYCAAIIRADRYCDRMCLVRFTQISLATKYRFLFGLAVLLIIGAALAVPWYTMEVLVQQQPFREAQSIAEGYFRLVMPDPGAISGAHAGRFSMRPEQNDTPPRFVPLVTTSDEATPQTGLETGTHSAFVQDAFATLRERPDKEFYYQSATGPDKRRFLYAHAVRATRGCLECHSEGRSASPYRENQLAGIIAVEVPGGRGGRYALVNRTVIIAAGALAGILAILVFYLITTRFILSPIHELRTVALKVADGDLAVRSTVRTGDEFEQLAVNINTMLERLRESQEELRKANRLLDEKLGQIAETNVALYESNRLKTEFLANVSHELRTPLTSIIGFAELLREGSSSEQDPRHLRFAENILISGRILLEIINDLLDLAKIEANRVELRIESVSLPEVCGGLVDFMRPLADKRQIGVMLEAPDGLPAVFTDRGRLRQVLFNLMSNAIKFTPEKGRVWLRIERVDETHVRMAVQDTGPGIPREKHEAIFEKFRQIDQSVTREHHGTGLGLAIAKELTTLLGGTIEVESEPGRGATFTVTLPTTAPEKGDRPLIALA